MTVTPSEQSVMTQPEEAASHSRLPRLGTFLAFPVPDREGMWGDSESPTKSEAEGSAGHQRTLFQSVRCVWGRIDGLPQGQRPGFVSQSCHGKLCDLGQIFDLSGPLQAHL